MVRGSIFSILIAIFCGFTFFVQAKQSPQDEVRPYLLPQDHPVKPLLDAIFYRTRAIFNLDTLVEAGFVKTKPRKFTKLVVTTHPAIPGYVFKLYLDAQRYYKDKPEHYYWILRVQGAQKVRDAIQNYGLEKLFAVPKKWIYELPKEPKPPNGYLNKLYILVEEDMHILSKEDNKKTWASNYVTHDLLFHLFRLLKEIGLSDSAKPDNIPFSVDGRIAFIDTQTFGKSKVRYEKLTPFLSESNRHYWKGLIDQ